MSSQQETASAMDLSAHRVEPGEVETTVVADEPNQGGTVGDTATDAVEAAPPVTSVVDNRPPRGTLSWNDLEEDKEPATAAPGASSGTVAEPSPTVVGVDDNSPTI